MSRGRQAAWDPGRYWHFTLVPVFHMQSRAPLRLLQVVVSPGDLVHLVRILSGKSKGSRMPRCLLHRASSVLGISWVFGCSNEPWASMLTLCLTCREMSGARAGYPHPGYWGPCQEWKQTQVSEAMAALFFPDRFSSYGKHSTVAFYETNNVKNI